MFPRATGKTPSIADAFIAHPATARPDDGTFRHRMVVEGPHGEPKHCADCGAPQSTTRICITTFRDYADGIERYLDVYEPKCPNGPHEVQR